MTSDLITRIREEYDESHLVTAVHYERFAWETMEFAELCPYSVIVFYDADGTAAANLYSILYRAFNRLKDMQVRGYLDYGRQCLQEFIPSL